MERRDVKYNCEWALTGKKSTMQLMADKFHPSHNFPELFIALQTKTAIARTKYPFSKEL